MGIRGNGGRSDGKRDKSKNRHRLYARDSDLTQADFIIGATGVGKYISKYNTSNGVVILNVKADTENVKVSLRGYMILKDNTTRNIMTYYSDMASAMYGSLS